MVGVVGSATYHPHLPFGRSENIIKLTNEWDKKPLGVICDSCRVFDAE